MRPLFADLLLFLLRKRFMVSLAHENQVDVIETFSLRYLDDLYNIVIDYFEQMEDKLYQKRTC